jgi:hypothetical protein
MKAKVLVTAAIAMIVVNFTGRLANARSTANATVPDEQEFRPFDRTSIPLASAIPGDVVGHDREMFSRLGQDEKKLVYCPWKDDELPAARARVQTLMMSDLDPNIKDKPYTWRGDPADQLGKLMMPWYYGKIDKADLWISKYWSKGVFSSTVKVWPHVFRGRGMEIFDVRTVPTSVNIEGLNSLFRTPDAVLIEDRIDNPSRDETNGTEGIIFVVNTNFVKFKEVYAAAQKYCVDHRRSRRPLVSGWRRNCLTNAGRDRDVEMSSVAQDSDTIIHVGFLCQQDNSVIVRLPEER